MTCSARVGSNTAGPACGDSRRLMCAAASTAPIGVCANPRARPSALSRGPSTGETGTFAPATVAQDNSSAPAAVTAGGPDAPVGAAAPDRPVPVATPAGWDTGVPRCPNATTNPTAAAAITSATMAATATMAPVRRRARAAMSSLMASLQDDADDGRADRTQGQAAEHPRDAGRAVHRGRGPVAPAEDHHAAADEHAQHATDDQCPLAPAEEHVRHVGHPRDRG